MFQSLTTPKKRNKSAQNKSGKHGASSGSNWSTSASTTPTATKTAAAATAATATTLERNERLQRDKLDVIFLKQQPRSITSRESPVGFCNATKAIATAAALVNCCRDVNCRFNAVQCTPPPLDNGDYKCKDNYACYNDDSVSTSSASQRSSVEKSTKALTSASLSTSKNNTNADEALTDNLARKTPTSTSTPVTTTPVTTTTTSSSVSAPASASETRASKQFSTLTPKGLSSIEILTTRLLNFPSTISIDLDIFSWILFLLAFCTRFYRLATPAHIVFDELHYGKYVAHYMRHMFFFDQHPPLGKQLIAAVAHLAGDFNGNATFTRIGAPYSENVPIFWLRFLPALCGSLLSPVVYKLLLQAGLNRWSSLLGGLLVIFDNALLTQSRFILMESMLLLFSTLGLYALQHFHQKQFPSFSWLLTGLSASILLTCAISVKYAGFFTFCLAVYLMCRYLWDLLYDCNVTDLHILMQTVTRILMFTIVPLTVYMAIFYIHLRTLTHAGPHDSAMTSAFQASLEGGLASITRGQPFNVVHGSQITLRHTHGRTCWLHSHTHVYPVRYPDKRGSSHQQQVTCYSFKDVNNWWIVKRPERDNLVVGDEPDTIRDGDVIQLVHGITSRALNSHDVAAPLTPQCQEVSCYIDYNIQMESEMLWRVDILNKETEGPIWHAIKSEIRLIHTTTGAALRFTGRQLPDWGFNQHEVVADRVIENQDAIWNVEEHRYTKTQDERERERQLLTAEMLPLKRTKLSFWDKFIELQTKMLWNLKSIQTHMYSSEPTEWPLLDKSIAYWVDNKSNSQIHLLGNVLLWYTATAGTVLYALLGIFYMIRRRRLCYDIDPMEWKRFLQVGDIFFVGYLLHYLPYFLMDRTLFLHNYLPALMFKLQLLCYVIEHIDKLIQRFGPRPMVAIFRLGVIIWLVCIVYVFWRFMPLSYGFYKLSAKDVMDLRWRDTWDFILQKEIQFSEKPLVTN